MLNGKAHRLTPHLPGTLRVQVRVIMLPGSGHGRTGKSPTSTVSIREMKCMRLAKLSYFILCSCSATGFIHYNSLLSTQLTLLQKFYYKKKWPKNGIRHSSGESDFFLDQKLHKNEAALDTRPYEQRVDKPRAARRMNQPFQHIYRHKDETFLNHDDEDEEDDTSLMDANSFLVKYGGFTPSEVAKMNKSYPALKMLDVEGKIKPMLKFIKYTMEGVLSNQSYATRSTEHYSKSPTTIFYHCFIDRLNEVWLKQQERSGETNHYIVPLSNVAKSAVLHVPQIFGARLERTIAPRHAFLVFKGLLVPYFGETLLKNDGQLLRTFLYARSSKQFAELCNRWAVSTDSTNDPVTDKQIEAFETYFRRGLMAAARNSVNDEEGAEYLKTLKNLNSSHLVELLISHGANSRETDIRGVSLLHWACGSGNLGAVKALAYKSMWLQPGTDTIGSVGIPSAVVKVQSERDGATPLHWAACGVTPKVFGSGGHLELCHWLLNTFPSIGERMNAVNAVTKDGNSVLMWASWSGSLDVVKFLLLENKADASLTNRNGCTVAHWAASGGNLELCQLLAYQGGVDFVNVVNHSGNSPLSHAVFHGRKEVIQWLLTERKEQDKRALDLAKEFVEWSKGDQKRQEILDMLVA